MPTCLVDISIIIHRSFHAMDFLQTSKGVPSGMEFGTLRTLKMLEKQYKNLIICFDKGKEKKEHAFYKAHREKKPASFYKRLERVSGVVQQLYSYAERPDTEADTIMHSLSYTVDHPVLLYTNDKDLHQSIQCDVFQIKSHHSKQFIWGEQEVWDKYKVTPEQWPLYRSLVGDPSDNIPKCKGIGADYAAELVRAATHICNPKYLNDPTSALDYIIDKANLSKKQRENWNNFRAQLRINYSLIRIPLIVLKEQPPLGGSIAEFLEEFEIKTIACEETEF